MKAPAKMNMAAKRLAMEQKRKAAAEAEAAGSPSKRPKFLGSLVPMPRSAGGDAVPAAAAARVQPSGGQDSPVSAQPQATAPGHKQQQQQQQGVSGSVAGSSSLGGKQQQQQKGRQAAQAVAAPSTGRAAKQTLLSPAKSARSTGSRAPLPAVLRQEEQEPVAPTASSE